MSDASKGNKKVLIGVVAGVIVVAAVAVVFMMKGSGSPTPDTGPAVTEGGPGMGPGRGAMPPASKVGRKGGPGPAMPQNSGPGLGGPAPAANAATATVSERQAPAGVPVKQMVDVDNTPPAPDGKTTPQATPPSGVHVPRVVVVSRPRTDPFALLPVEVAADKAAAQEAMLARLGGFLTVYKPAPKPPNPKLDPVEKQPYRRLAGIIRGEAVSAIVEEEGSSSPLVVKPGDKLGVWTVRSIDNEKMVLTREGKVKPKTLVVRLEAKATVSLDTSGGSSGNPGGGNPGGPSNGGGPGRRGGGRKGGPGGGAPGGAGGGGL